MVLHIQPRLNPNNCYYFGLFNHIFVLKTIHFEKSLFTCYLIRIWVYFFFQFLFSLLGGIVCRLLATEILPPLQCILDRNIFHWIFFLAETELFLGSTIFSNFFRRISRFFSYIASKLTRTNSIDRSEVWTPDEMMNTMENSTKFALSLHLSLFLLLLHIYGLWHLTYFRHDWFR